MMILVTGGAGSGKSEYAEQFIASLPETGRKYYIATMRCADDESLRRVERHRLMRKDKGFVTIEQPTDIEQALEKTEESGNNRDKADTGSTVLLECVSNLTANEMFTGDGFCEKEQVVERVVSGIKKIKERTSVLAAVTNNIFEDGICYEDGTKEYIKALGMINRRLAEEADEVVEVVCGIPVKIK